jgi:hypothetical protein
MMLFVVGLNHQSGGCINCGVDGPGMKALASAIHQAWSHPENVVVVSSSFRAPCVPGCNVTDPPAPPEALIQELESQYAIAGSFSLREYQADQADAKWGTMGVITGARWALEGGQHREFNSGVAEVWLRDTTTGLTLPIFALHTDFDHASAVADIKSSARAAAREVNGGGVAILAGDFNFVESSLGDDEGKALRESLAWANKDVTCRGIADLPDGIFRLQEGNLMHALTGRIQSPEADLAFTCASAELQPVRLAYSVDAHDSLAVRPGDGRPAEREGIILDDIAHNVVALGLKIRKRADPLPSSCNQCPTGHPWCACTKSCATKADCSHCKPHICTAPATWCDCTQSCLNHTLCRRREDEGGCVQDP